MGTTKISQLIYCFRSRIMDGGSFRQSVCSGRLSDSPYIGLRVENALKDVLTVGGN